MSALAKLTLAVSILVLQAGCITDEPVVYKNNVVSKEAAKAYAGVYQVEDWPGDVKPETIRVTEQNGELRLAYSDPMQDVDVRFLLSKIPHSERDLYVLSVPGQGDDKKANVYFIGRAEKDETHIWVVTPNMPVAQEHLAATGGKAKAEDVKAFLAKHADEFVTANKPQVTLTR